MKRKKVEDIVVDAWNSRAISQGENLEELKENMKDAISLILESIRLEADTHKKKSLIVEV